jgi:nucleoside-diphosphate-sugar epimerase
MSRIAVIGSTGFVGGNLMTQVGEADGYNSKNIEDIAGREYDLLFCAGARAEMWRINADPEPDRANNKRLMDNMAKAKIKQLVLMSTVGVYPNPVRDVDEDSPIDEAKLTPYGLHHLELEHFCQDHFDSTIVRLPGLFGPGIKKNVIYDFLHDNNIDQIHSEGVHQYYNLGHVWRDTQTAMKAGLRLVNFATPPISVAEVAREVFGRKFTNRPEGKTPAYFDFRTKYAEVFGGHDGYMQDKASVLAEMREFVTAEQQKA